jgi:hypothetical protein
MKKVRITIENKMHNTQATATKIELVRSSVNRIRKMLCPSRECQCSNAIGQRGAIWDQDGLLYEFYQYPDGSGKFIPLS